MVWRIIKSFTEFDIYFVLLIELLLSCRCWWFIKKSWKKKSFDFCVLIATTDSMIIILEAILLTFYSICFINRNETIIFQKLQLILFSFSHSITPLSVKISLIFVTRLKIESNIGICCKKKISFSMLKNKLFLTLTFVLRRC